MREWLKLRREDLAKIVGVCEASISHWENGRVPFPASRQRHVAFVFRDLTQNLKKKSKNRTSIAQ